MDGFICPKTIMPLKKGISYLLQVVSEIIIANSNTSISKSTTGNPHVGNGNPHIGRGNPHVDIGVGKTPAIIYCGELCNNSCFATLLKSHFGMGVL